MGGKGAISSGGVAGVGVLLAMVRLGRLGWATVIRRREGGLWVSPGGGPWTEGGGVGSGGGEAPRALERMSSFFLDPL